VSSFHKFISASSRMSGLRIIGIVLGEGSSSVIWKEPNSYHDFRDPASANIRNMGKQHICGRHFIVLSSWHVYGNRLFRWTISHFSRVWVLTKFLDASRWLKNRKIVIPTYSVSAFPGCFVGKGNSILWASFTFVVAYETSMLALKFVTSRFCWLYDPSSLCSYCCEGFWCVLYCY
jgi:hypothetical protein